MYENRDSKGRFLPGNPGGPGRPRRAIELEYAEALRETVPIERFKRMADKVATHVEETGSIRAFMALSDRILGRPAQTIVTEDSGIDRAQYIAQAIAAKIGRPQDLALFGIVDDSNDDDDGDGI